MTHINKVPISDKIIKIRVRRNIDEKILGILPSKYISILKRQGWNSSKKDSDSPS